MWPATSALKLAQEQLLLYRTQIEDERQLKLAQEKLQSAYAITQEHYQKFHSIQWNRSRVKIKQETNAELQILANEAYTNLMKARTLLNKYSDSLKESSSGIEIWIKMIENLKLARTNIEQSLLN